MVGTCDPLVRWLGFSSFKAGEEVSAMSLHLTLDPLLEGLLMDRTPA
jgi:hypothetical protein